MPEVLTAVSTLKMPNGNSSETDAATTERSSSSTSTTPIKVHPNKKRNQPIHQVGQNKKARKSTGRRVQKSPLKSSSQQKNVAAVGLNLKTQIPRALLLTPSSSSTSLTTEASSLSLSSSSPSSTPSTSARRPAAKHTDNSKAVVSVENSKAVIQTQTLQRQNTKTAILNFHIRRSVSQMEFKRGHGRNMPPPLAMMDQNAKKALIPNNCQDVTSASQTTLMSKFYEHDNYYYVMSQDRDPRVAGMRIFATIMLNAWRKRRDQVKHLMEEVNDLKRGSIKSKNQLHVFNTLFRVEQKRNDELSCQLKNSLDDINNTKSSCESLTTSLISLKADKALMEQQMQIKDQEYESINTILTQTKSDLFKAMTVQRELQANLSQEQRKVQMLENQKNELINEICELNADAKKKEEKLVSELKEKTDLLESTQIQIKMLEEVVHDLKDKEIQLEDIVKSESLVKAELDVVRREVETLQHCLGTSIGNRLRTCWNNSVTYQKATLQLLHWVAFCALPATPPPKMKTLPFALTFEKALSIVKR